eukprot:5193507-Pyramimonas_sp.AAC.1
MPSRAGLRSIEAPRQLVPMKRMDLTKGEVSVSMGKKRGSPPKTPHLFGGFFGGSQEKVVVKEVVKTVPVEK